MRRGTPRSSSVEDVIRDTGRLVILRPDAQDRLHDPAPPPPTGDGRAERVTLDGDGRAVPPGDRDRIDPVAAHDVAVGHGRGGSGWSVSRPSAVSSSRRANRPASSTSSRPAWRSPSPVDTVRASAGRVPPPRPTRSPATRRATRPDPPGGASRSPVRGGLRAVQLVRGGLGPASRDGLELAGQRRRDPPDDAHVALAVLELDRPPLADAREQLAGRVRQGDVDVDPERGEQRGDLGARACPSRSRSGPRRTPSHRPPAPPASRPARPARSGRPC